MSSEELVGYVAKAIKEALSRYDEARINPLEKKLEELDRDITLIKNSLVGIRRKLEVLPVFEEKAIYQATRAIAEARITMQAKQLVKEIQEEMDYNKFIDRFILPLVGRLRPLFKLALRDAIQEVTLPIDEKAIYETVSSAIDDYLSSKLEDKFLSIGGDLAKLFEMVRHLEGVVNALQQDIRALNETLATTRTTLTGVVRRVGKLEEEVTKLRGGLEPLISRLREAE